MPTSCELIYRLYAIAIYEKKQTEENRKENPKKLFQGDSCPTKYYNSRKLY